MIELLHSFFPILVFFNFDKKQFSEIGFVGLICGRFNNINLL